MILRVVCYNTGDQRIQWLERLVAFEFLPAAEKELAHLFPVLAKHQNTFALYSQRSSMMHSPHLGFLAVQTYLPCSISQ